MINGVVCSKELSGNEPLIGANILIYGIDSALLTATFTDQDGRFVIEMNRMPNMIKISHAGYEPCFVRDLSVDQTVAINLDTCFLVSNNILDEATVTASTVRHNLGSESYVITNKMRSTASNTPELLDRIHGVRYDKMTNSIKVGNETNILFLVNNVAQSKDYIFNINPERISKVEVGKNPGGRHQSEGYEAVINIVLKNQYEGYDINLRNFAVANLFDNNGNDRLMGEQPGINIVYTNSRLNVFANHTYGRSNWNMPVEKKVRYEHVIDMQSEKTDGKNPNDIYSYRGNVLDFGMNCHINADHVLSFQGDYSHEKTHVDNIFNFSVTDLKNGSKGNILNLTTNKTAYSNYSATLFYDGKAGERFGIYSDLACNYYLNNAENALVRNGGSLSDIRYAEKRMLVKFHSELKYSVSEKVQLNFGYSGNLRKYDSRLNSGQELLDYEEYRYGGFASIRYNPSENMEFELGAGMEWINMGAKSSALQKYREFLPVLNVNYNVSDNLNLKVAYLTTVQYPGLYQLNPVYTQIDSLMSQKGNPDVKASPRHSISMDVNIFNRITITPMLRYTPRLIGELLYGADDRFISTFQNMNTKEYSLQLVYDQPLGNYFNFTSGISYHYGTVKYGYEKNAVSGWLINSEIGYFNPRHSLAVQLGYYREMDKKVRIQGYQMYNFDNWAISVNKKLFKDRASIMLAYFLPLEWGMRSVQEKYIHTPYYNESYNISLKPYRNILVCSFSYRFNSGSIKLHEKKSSIEKEARINRTFDF
ncbi:MAG: outer membrane beta-barrel protein [Tannerella sp.]|nr:outer membrane beta-barrel protein [Tannerella sp.]